MKDDRKPARLEDVAAEAGLSPAAVSRYLSGKLSLPAATSERIDEAVRKLAYKPNPHASGLSRGRADAIGLVVPDIANPFFARLAAEIEREVDALGLALVLGVTLNRAGRELEYIERLRRNHVDSLIFMTNHVGTARLAREINAARSVVLVDEDIAGTNVPKVFCDNERGGYLATRHLIEAGHRRLGFVGGPMGMYTNTLRLGGYRKAIRESGPGTESVFESFNDYTREGGRLATQELLASASGATALFYTSDAALLGGLEILGSAMVSVPGTMSLISFDDVEPLSLLHPPVTAIHQPLAEMGRRSVKAVLGHSSLTRSSEDLVPISLVIRESVKAPTL